MNSRLELANLEPWQMQARAMAQRDQADAIEQDVGTMLAAWNESHPNEKPLTLEEIRGADDDN